VIEKNNKYNVVATSSLGTKMDLLAIMKVFRNVEYRPKRFPGLVFRLKNARAPKTAGLFNASSILLISESESIPTLMEGLSPRPVIIT